MASRLYTVFHPLVVEALCVSFLTLPACIVQKQNSRNFYKRMIDGKEEIVPIAQKIFHTIPERRATPTWSTTRR